MRTYIILSLAILFLLLATVAFAQTTSQFALTWSSVSSGGGISQGQNGEGDFYTLEGMAAQTGTGSMRDPRYTITTGSLAAPPPVTNLVLLYVNADNNLAAYIQERLLPKALAGALNPNVVPLMVLDGPGEQDAHLYRLGATPRERQRPLNCNLFDDYTCNGIYADGENVWPFDENVTDPIILSNFVAGQMQAYAAQRVVLSLIGHGGGWSPDLLAGQPQGHGGKPDDELGGLLWDDHTELGVGNSLSTLDLGNALRTVYQQTGQKIDLLYLDACLMSMWEVAYEVRESVHYLLASESWSWTSFAYEAHLRNLDNVQPVEEIGKRWIQHEIPELAGYPFTYSLIDLSQMESVTAAVNALSVALQTTLPDGQLRILEAFGQSACFDSNTDHEINLTNPTQGKGIDNYCDLSSFALHLREGFNDVQAVVDATVAVQTAISSAVKTQDYRCGIPRDYSPNRWCWSALGGLSIYVPLGQDEWKRRFYGQLQSTKDTKWDEFLSDYWRVEAPVAPACQSCAPLPLGPLPITHQGYLPLVAR